MLRSLQLDSTPPSRYISDYSLDKDVLNYHMQKLSKKVKQFDSWTKASNEQSLYDFEIKRQVQQMCKRYKKSNNKLIATRNRRIESSNSHAEGIEDSFL